MTTFSLADCCTMLGIDPKTLRHWFHQAQMPLHVHPTDARIKCLTKEQVQQLAAAHGRPIELPPALASSPLVQACPQGMLETPRIRLSGLLVSFSFFFRFVGQQGRFSAYRKGRMSRGWSAYRTIHQHDYQHYLGTTDHLTIDCLEQMAAKLQFHMRSLSFAEPCPVLSSFLSKQVQL